MPPNDGAAPGLDFARAALYGKLKGYVVSFCAMRPYWASMAWRRAARYRVQAGPYLKTILLLIPVEIALWAGIGIGIYRLAGMLFQVEE
jgi:hypothetical protein